MLDAGPAQPNQMDAPGTVSVEDLARGGDTRSAPPAECAASSITAAPGLQQLRSYDLSSACIGSRREAIPSAWFRRNVLQPCDGGRRCRAMYLATEVWPTSMPSLSSMDARSAPERICQAPLADQLPNLERHLGPAGSPSRFPTPEAAESSTMPSYNRL